MLTVTDTGTGIPADELPRLFERFHRVERARARSGEGSGIGLAVVRELVGLHGGAIAVDSTPDRGTTFTVTLPLGHEHLPPDRIGPADADGGDPADLAAVAEPFVTEALRWLPADAGPAGGGSRSRSRRRAGCWSPTTTRTCASTCRGCSARATRCRRSATVPRRSRRPGRALPTSSSAT